MEKLIIENRADIPMRVALVYAKKVVEEGRISNYGKNYCYVTVFKDGTTVSSWKNKKSDRLVVTHEP